MKPNSLAVVCLLLALCVSYPIDGICSAHVGLNYSGFDESLNDEQPARGAESDIQLLRQQFGSNGSYEEFFKLVDKVNDGDCNDELIKIFKEVNRNLSRSKRLSGILSYLAEKIGPACERFLPAKVRIIDHPNEVEDLKRELMSRVSQESGGISSSNNSKAGGQTDAKILWPIEFMSRLDSGAYFKELELIKMFLRLANQGDKLRLRQTPLAGDEVERLKKMKKKSSNDRKTLKLRTLMEDKLFIPAGYIVEWSRKFFEPVYEYIGLIDDINNSHDYGKQFVSKQSHQYKALLFQYRACLDILKIRQDEWRLRKVYFESASVHLSGLFDGLGKGKASQKSHDKANSKGAEHGKKHHSLEQLLEEK